MTTLHLLTSALFVAAYLAGTCSGHFVPDNGPVNITGSTPYPPSNVTPILSPNGAMLCPIIKGFFSYNTHSPYGPEHWPLTSPCCAGKRQSPRNLQTNSPTTRCGVEQPHFFRYMSNRTIVGKLFNSGHDPVVSFTPPNTAHLYDVPYTPGIYVLDNIHLHFHDIDGHGSEHAIDNVFFDSEVHLVHYKRNYGTVEEAALHEDGLVVIAILLKKVRNADGNRQIINMINAMKNLKGVGRDYHVPFSLMISRLLPDSSDYLTYAGSLTTPPCSESVRWIVMAEPIEIHHSQLLILTQLLNGQGGLISHTSNDRPLQESRSPVVTNFRCGPGYAFDF